MKICFATHNENKLREVRRLLPGFEVVGLNDLGITEEIVEDGATLDENATIKAEYVWKKCGVDCFADDTGLEVSNLNGAPGVYSARYAGNQKNNQANIELLLKNLTGKSDRSARFRTVICLIQNGDKTLFEGIVKGRITNELHGTEGFGYDPVFTPEGFGSTFAEMAMEEKNKISHRGRAIQQLISFLESNQ